MSTKMINTTVVELYQSHDLVIDELLNTNEDKKSVC